MIQSDADRTQRKLYQKKYKHSAKLVLTNEKLGLQWHAIVPKALGEPLYAFLVRAMDRFGLSAVELRLRRTTPRCSWVKSKESNHGESKKPP